MPLGGPNRSLGSIEFLEGRQADTPMVLFREGTQVRGRDEEEASDFAELPDLDYCVMNPPFARSVVGNLLFGSVPESDRAGLQQRLSRLIDQHSAEASTTAGLGSVFVAVGDSALREGGGLGLVLPKAVLSGVAWTPTRRLLGRDYNIEVVVSSHDPERWNFSENTELSEALLLARKKIKPKVKSKQAELKPSEEPDALIVNFWRNPTTIFEALACARELDRQAPRLEEEQGALTIRLGTEKIGEAFRVKQSELKVASWGVYAAFAQTDLVRSASGLMKGTLVVPGDTQEYTIPLCSLKELGDIGPDVRDIHDGFERTTTRTQYPAHWGNDSNDVTTISRSPNQFLEPRSAAATGRPLRDAAVLWSRSGRIMVTARLWLNTYRIVAALMPKNALGSGWWPFRLTEKSTDDERSHQALVAWLNSTLGIMGILSIRVDTRGAWTQFKKPMLEEMPVIDIRALDDDAIAGLAGAYEAVSQTPLQSFPHMHGDAGRRELDRRVSEALGLPDLDTLRMLLGQEPSVCLRPLT